MISINRRHLSVCASSSSSLSPRPPALRVKSPQNIEQERVVRHKLAVTYVDQYTFMVLLDTHLAIVQRSCITTIIHT